MTKLLRKYQTLTSLLLLFILPLLSGCPWGENPHKIAQDTARLMKMITVIVENQSTAPVVYSISYNQQANMPVLYFADATATKGLPYLHNTNARELAAGSSDAYQGIYYSTEDLADEMFSNILKADFLLTLSIPGTEPRTYAGTELADARTGERLQAVLHGNASSVHLTLTITNP